jgi:hypothetical protein
LVHALDPPGWASVPIAAGDFDSNLSSVLDIPIWWGCEWLLHDQGCPCCGHHLPFGCAMLFKEEVLHVVEITSALHGKDQAVDELT